MIGTGTGTTSPPTTTSTTQPVCTAFISNIPPGTPDDLLHSLLHIFGPVHHWRRLKEPSGALKPSGFVDFYGPEPVLLAARILPRVDLYAGPNKRLSVKHDAGLASTTTSGASARTEEGELVDERAVFGQVLQSMMALFQQRRMINAVECCARLIDGLDRDTFATLADSVQNSTTSTTTSNSDEVAKEETEWLKKEWAIFKEYHDYLSSLVSDTGDGGPESSAAVRAILNIYHSDRKAFRRDHPDTVYQAHCKSVAQALPADTAALFAHPIDWSRLSVGRLRRWLLVHRGLTSGQADAVIECLVKRLGPEQISRLIHSISGGDGEVFTVRLWRWIILDTAC
jgi:hypothetical protein